MPPTESAFAMPFARPLRLTTALVAGLATVALLAGCSHDSSTAKSTQKAGSTASAAPSHGATDGQHTQSATPTPTPTPTPVTLPQGQVWTAQQVYDFNPNFSADPSYKLKADSPAAPLVKLDGVSYGWVNQTSGDTIEIAVAHPSPDNIDQFNGQIATSSQQVPIDGAPAGTISYFDVANGVGTLEVFTNNGYWFEVDSTTFLEPGDSYQIATAVMGNLK
jgi:hypothetical protein